MILDAPRTHHFALCGRRPGGYFRRGLANQLTQKLGQPVVVESKGAAGMAGVDYVAKLTPDGYTLVLTAGLSLVGSSPMSDQ